MDGPGAEVSSGKRDEVPERLQELRGPIFDRWKECVWSTIPEAKELDEKVLTNALHRFYDDIMSALRTGSAYSVTAVGVGSSCSHGRERATSTKYGPKELVQELQLLRQVIFEVADKHNLDLQSRHRSLISRSIETAALDAVNAFAITQKEVSEIFITSLSHDLRNPLNVAMVSTQLIEQKSNEENITALAKRARKKLLEIDAMIQTLLDASQLKGRKKLRLNISRFDIRDLAEEVCADMSSPHHPIYCESDPVLGYWCPTSIRRVLENLLSNAQKYGAPDTPINLHINRVSENIVIEVHNKGIPIPTTDRHLLFSTFHRFEDINVKGWGLGLPLVQLVTESHGGTISVTSNEEAGTTFKITIPIDCRQRTI